VRQYLGTVVRSSDNFFAALIRRCQRRLVLLHGEGVRCPMELRLTSASTPKDTAIRAHADHRGRSAYVSYLEGCTAPLRATNQLHARCELVALDRAQIKYSTVQNWIRATKRQGESTFRHQRGRVRGVNSKICWRRWRPDRRSPGSIRLLLIGGHSVGEFYSWR